MNRLNLLILLCLITGTLVAADSDDPDEIKGTVTAVIEGDTFLLKTAKQQLKIGIDSVEAPELDEPFGESSRKALVDLIEGKEVTVTRTGGKKTRLLIGIVLLNDQNIGSRMVELGWARQLKKPVPDKELAKLEELAREQKRGIWSDDDPTDENDDAEEVALKKRVRADVEQMNDAMLTGDLTKLVDLTHPKAVEMLGGRESMIAVIEKTNLDMKKRGMEIKSNATGNPSDPVTTDDEMYIVVPHKLEMKAPGGKLHVNAFVIGISTDEGKSWKYVNGDLTHKMIKQVLPNLPDELKLPAKKAPVFEKDK